jgi:hypothetical protein
MRYSETSVDFQRAACHYISEGTTLYNRGCENLRSYISLYNFEEQILRQAKQELYFIFSVLWYINWNYIIENGENICIVVWLFSYISTEHLTDHGFMHLIHRSYVIPRFPNFTIILMPTAISVNLKANQHVSSFLRKVNVLQNRFVCFTSVQVSHWCLCWHRNKRDLHLTWIQWLVTPVTCRTYRVLSTWRLSFCHSFYLIRAQQIVLRPVSRPYVCSSFHFFPDPSVPHSAPSLFLTFLIHINYNYHQRHWLKRKRKKKEWLKEKEKADSRQTHFLSVLWSTRIWSAEKCLELTWRRSDQNYKCSRPTFVLYSLSDLPYFPVTTNKQTQQHVSGM